MFGIFEKDDDLQQLEKNFKVAQENEAERMKFVWEIMKTPYTDYYYSLLVSKDIDEQFRSKLWSRFDEQREKGAELLLSKISNNEDTDFHPHIIFCLGKLADKNIEKKRTLEFARMFADSTNEHLREKAIIVLGWIGGDKEILLLGEHLLNDPSILCRTWSATSFMQMYFRKKSQSLVNTVLPYLKQAISQERDYFALGCMINVVKELTGKKFDLPQYAIENGDKERIDNAKLKVLRFFNKLYNE